MAVPMAASAKGVNFGAFQRGTASFRVAGVALCDIRTCFMTCQKWLCVAGAIFATFSEDALHVSWQEQLWRPPMSFCVAGAALWTCRVACFLRIALSALRAVVTRCKFRG